MIRTLLVIFAVILAMSGLARYWLTLWRGESHADNRPRLPATIAAIVATVPFLMPGLAPLILSNITQAGLPSTSDSLLFTLIIITITTIGAIGLGYFRTQIITRFNISSTALIRIFDLQWLLIWAEKTLGQIGKSILRVNVILEGQHYIGWALFTALVGTLIVILTRNL
jgi:hypothetical protein